MSSNSLELDDLLAELTADEELPKVKVSARLGSPKAEPADVEAIVIPKLASPKAVPCASPTTAVEAAREQTKCSIDGDEIDDLLSEVLDAGSAPEVTRSGTSQPEHSLVPNLHCLACDHQILRVDGFAWRESHVDYMFLRNYYPNVQRLGLGLEPNARSVAYCCQCSWRSAPDSLAIEDVEKQTNGGNPEAGLRWRVVQL